MRDLLVLRVIVQLVIPFILLFGFYVLMHGKYSPGGGFQAGVILAAAFIAHGLVFGVGQTQKVIPLDMLRISASLGTLVYAGVGIAGMLSGGHFLNYNVVLDDPLQGQFWMIMLVECGIGLTVASVMLGLFYLFALFRPHPHKPSELRNEALRPVNQRAGQEDRP